MLICPQKVKKGALKTSASINGIKGVLTNCNRKTFEGIKLKQPPDPYLLCPIAQGEIQIALWSYLKFL